MENNKYIKLIKLNNVKALTVQEFNLDSQLNIIKSSNEGGKSSFLEVVEFVCSDRMQPGWIRTNNEGDAWIECYVSDGTSIKVEIDETGKASRTIKDADGKKIKNDRAWLADNVSISSIDAGRFFERTEWGYRVNMVVEALGLNADKNDWINKYGQQDDLYKLIQFDDPIFNQIETADEFFREKRRDANVAKDEHLKTIERLKASLPEKSDIDYTEKLQKNSEQRDVIQGQIENDIEEQKNVSLDIVDGIKIKQAVIDDEIAKLESKIISLKGDKNVLEQEINTEREKLKGIISDIRGHYSEKLQENSSENIRLLKEKEIIDNSAGIMKQIDISSDAAKRLQSEWEKYQEYIDMLAIWKKEIGENVPIKGLAIEGKDLSVDGKPWKIANTAKQAEIFLQLIELKFAGKPIKPVLMDNFESIGDGIRKLLWPKMQEGGFQGIFAQADIPIGRELRVLAGFDAVDRYGDEK